MQIEAETTVGAPGRWFCSGDCTDGSTFTFSYLDDRDPQVGGTGSG